MSKPDSTPADTMSLQAHCTLIGWIGLKVILLILLVQVKAAQFIYNGF